MALKNGILDGSGGFPRSPTRVAGQVISCLRQPSKLRGRLAIAAAAVLIFICTVSLSSGNINFHETASSLGHYVPELRYPFNDKYDGMRWDDDLVEMPYTLTKKPKFHLLVPANKPSANVCKTLLSAAILNYPPPTLVNYAGIEEDPHSNTGAARGVYRYLSGKEVHDDDLALIVEDNTWFQLPAGVMINRFMESRRVADRRLRERYGAAKEDIPGTTSVDARPSKFHESVLYGAGKTCSTDARPNPACYGVPQSPLAAELPLEELPIYMEPGNTIGKVSDLRPIYERANAKLDFTTTGAAHGSHFVLSEIFGEQEFQREVTRQSSMGASAKWHEWLSEKLGSSEKMLNTTLFNMTVVPNSNYEFGIGLDYEMSVFQVMNSTTQDIRFIKFEDLAQINYTAVLPADLNNTRLPLQQHQEPTQASTPSIKPQIDAIPRDLNWKDVSLVANIAIPGFSVPAAIQFRGAEALLNDWWRKMWFQPWARALLRQSMRSSQGTAAATAAAEGGKRWWNLRGGKGGVWTDRGEWLAWDEVCGAYDDELFGDGNAELAEEEPYINSFGNLIAGKPKKSDQQTS